MSRTITRSRVALAAGLTSRTVATGFLKRDQICRCAVARGLSIVEMMVGITIGLFILAAASMVATSQLTGNRDAMVRVQMQQDLRVIADMMANAIARGAFYRAVEQRVLPASAPLSYETVYDGLSIGGVAGPGRGSSIEFSSSSDEDFYQVDGKENDTLDVHDLLGFRLDTVTGTVSMLLREGGWQTLSDPQLMRVTDLRVDVTERFVPVACGLRCETTSSGCAWSVKTREFVLRIDAVAVSNPSVQRSVEQVVRARNPMVAPAPTC